MTVHGNGKFVQYGSSSLENKKLWRISQKCLNSAVRIKQE